MTRLLGILYALVPNLTRSIFYFALQKAVSVLYGPAGLLLFGAMSNILSMANTLALGGTYNGLVVRMSGGRSGILSGDIRALSVLTLLGLLTCLTVLFIAIFLLDMDWVVNIRSRSIYLVLAALIAGYIGYSMAALANSYLVASQWFGQIAWVGVLSVVLAFILFLPLYLLGSEPQVLIFSPALYAIGAGIAAWPVLRTLWTRLQLTPETQSGFVGVTRYTPFVAMSAASAIVTPISALYILDVFVDSSSTENAGVFYALTRLSDLVNVFIGPVIASYLFPRFVGCLDSMSNFRQIYKYLIVVFLTSLVALQVLATFSMLVVPLLFSDDFLIDVQLARAYFVGDALRTFVVMGGYIVISSGSFKWYLFFTVLYNGLLVIAAEVLVPIGGAMAYSYAYIAVGFLNGVGMVSWAAMWANVNQNRITGGSKP